MAGIFLEKYKNNRLTLLKKNSIFLTIRRDILFITKSLVNITYKVLALVAYRVKNPVNM